MTAPEVKLYNWHVEKGVATAIGTTIYFDTYLENGIYEGPALDIVWQSRKNDTPWWDNLQDEPSFLYKENRLVRQLIRAETNSRVTPTKFYTSLEVKALISEVLNRVAENATAELAYDDMHKYSITIDKESILNISFIDLL